MSRTRQLLNQLRNPQLYVHIPDRVIFDEHEEVIWEKNGRQVPEGTPGARKQVRRFTRKRLERIARRCNQRDAGGTLSPLTFGHTNPRDPDETQQPKPVGWAHGYKVGYDPDLGRHVLTAGFYVKRSHWNDAKSFPRVSIELWPAESDDDIEGDVIDPIALLRRTPARDLGDWTSYSRALRFASGKPAGLSSWSFSRSGRTVLRYSLEFSNMARKARRYGMDEENDLDTPPPPMDEEAGLDDAPPIEGDGDADDLPHEEKVDQFMKHLGKAPHLQYMCKHYAAGGEDMPMMGDELLPEGDTGGMGDAPVGLPEGGEEPEAFSAFASGTNGQMPKRYSRPGGINAYRRNSPQVEAALNREARAKGENWVLRLAEHEGFDMDEEAEVLQFAQAYRSGGDKACEHHAARIRRYHRPRITHQVGRIPTEPGMMPEAPATMSRQHEQALQYMRERSGSTYEEALNACKRNGHGR